VREYLSLLFTKNKALLWLCGDHGPAVCKIEFSSPAALGEKGGGVVVVYTILPFFRIRGVGLAAGAMGVAAVVAVDGAGGFRSVRCYIVGIVGILGQRPGDPLKDFCSRFGQRLEAAVCLFG